MANFDARQGPPTDEVRNCTATTITLRNGDITIAYFKKKVTKSSQTLKSIEIQNVTISGPFDNSFMRTCKRIFTPSISLPQVENLHIAILLPSDAHFQKRVKQLLYFKHQKSRLDKLWTLIPSITEMELKINNITWIKFQKPKFLLVNRFPWTNPDVYLQESAKEAALPGRERKHLQTFACFYNTVSFENILLHKLCLSNLILINCELISQGATLQEALCQLERLTKLTIDCGRDVEFSKGTVISIQPLLERNGRLRQVLLGHCEIRFGSSSWKNIFKDRTVKFFNCEFNIPEISHADEDLAKIREDFRRGGDFLLTVQNGESSVEKTRWNTRKFLAGEKGFRISPEDALLYFTTFDMKMFSTFEERHFRPHEDIHDEAVPTVPGVFAENPTHDISVATVDGSTPPMYPESPEMRQPDNTNNYNSISPELNNSNERQTSDDNKHPEWVTPSSTNQDSRRRPAPSVASSVGESYHLDTGTGFRDIPSSVLTQVALPNPRGGATVEVHPPSTVVNHITINQYNLDQSSRTTQIINVDESKHFHQYIVDRDTEWIESWKGNYADLDSGFSDWIRPFFKRDDKKDESATDVPAQEPPKVYNLEGKKLLVLLICNTFRNHPDPEMHRNNWNSELEIISASFKSNIHCDVCEFVDSSGSENLSEVIDKALKKIKSEDYGGLFVAVMTHNGSASNSLLMWNLKEEVMEEVDVFRHLIYRFNHTDCPKLKKKPKLFLIQACQDYALSSKIGESSGKSGTSAGASNRTLELEQKRIIQQRSQHLNLKILDVLLMFSTLPYKVSKRRLYISEFVKEVLNNKIPPGNEIRTIFNQIEERVRQQSKAIRLIPKCPEDTSTMYQIPMMAEISFKKEFSFPMK